MVDSLLRSVSLIHIFANKVEQKFLSFFRVSLEGFMVKVEIAFDDISDDFKFRVAWEWHLARQHDVEHNAQRPNVNLHVVVLQEDFRRNVVGRSAHRAHAVLAREIFAEAEVDHFYAGGVVFAAEHKVFRLDVPMRNVV